MEMRAMSRMWTRIRTGAYLKGVGAMGLGTWIRARTMQGALITKKFGNARGTGVEE